MRDRVDQMILEEMSTFQPVDYLSQMPPPPVLQAVSTELIANEMQRLQEGGRLAVPNVVEAFDCVKAPVEKDIESMDAWEAAVAKAKVAMEAQAFRSLNLELMSRYGVEAWKAHVEGIDKIHTTMKARVAALQSKLDSVNHSRRSQQESAGSKLRTLVRKWHDTVETNVQVELACHDAEREVHRLKLLARQHGLGADQ
jgi:pre-mRNA-splicing factor SPF27